jgi:hypothetical protein
VLELLDEEGVLYTRVGLVIPRGRGLWSAFLEKTVGKNEGGAVSRSDEVYCEVKSRRLEDRFAVNEEGAKKPKLRRKAA